jgi:hypothetical protein
MNGGALHGPDDGPLGHCPKCGSERFAAVTNSLDVNFRCDTCWSCWSVSFGRVSRVDPLSCPGCADAGHCRGANVRATADVSAGAALSHIPPPGGTAQPFKSGPSLPMKNTW